MKIVSVWWFQRTATQWIFNGQMHKWNLSTPFDFHTYSMSIYQSCLKILLITNCSYTKSAIEITAWPTCYLLTWLFCNYYFLLQFFVFVFWMTTCPFSRHGLDVALWNEQNYNMAYHCLGYDLLLHNGSKTPVVNEEKSIKFRGINILTRKRIPTPIKRQ